MKFNYRFFLIIGLMFGVDLAQAIDVPGGWWRVDDDGDLVMGGEGNYTALVGINVLRPGGGHMFLQNIELNDGMSHRDFRRAVVNALGQEVVSIADNDGEFDLASNRLIDIGRAQRNLALYVTLD